MTSKQVLDLRGVISPLNLLKCKICLMSMAEDEVLEVLLTDTDVADDLILILEKSRDNMIYQKKAADCICLGIQRGKNPKQQEVS